jgi:hypothetical protein
MLNSCFPATNLHFANRLLDAFFKTDCAIDGTSIVFFDLFFVFGSSALVQAQAEGNSHCPAKV